MIETVDIGITPEEFKNTVVKFFPSLRNYPERYLSLFFNPNATIPEHVAYLCPLCLSNGFLLLSDLFADTKCKFSQDHFPPQSVGGFLTVPVCKKCNNDAGGKYEDSVKEMIQLMSLNNKIVGAKITGKVKVDGLTGRYYTSVTVREDGEFEISFKPNTKAHTPLLDQWLDTSADDKNWKADLELPETNQHKVAKSFLKAAYLHCFDAWGYEFCFSYTGGMIREMLNDKAEYPMEIPSFWLGNNPTNSRLPLGVCHLWQPSDWKCFVVNMEIKDLSTGYRNLASVIIPGPEEACWTIFPGIKEVLSSGLKLNVTMAHVTENLLHYGITDGFAKSWGMHNNSITS